MDRASAKMWAKNARSGGLLSAAMGIWALIASLLLMPLASAGPGDFFAPLVVLSGTLIGGGILLVIMGWVLGKFGGEPGDAVRDPLVGIGAVLLVIGIVGMVIPYIPTTTTPPPPPGGGSLSIVCGYETPAEGGPGGAHNAATEFPSGNALIAADGGTPDYDSTIGTPVYEGTKIARLDITVDDELNMVPGTGSNANGWFPEDAYAYEVHCVPSGVPTAVGGGFRAISYYGQWSVPYLFGQKGNATDNPVFICDASNGGLYVGFGKNVDSGSTGTAHDANHDFVSAWNSRTCTGLSTTSDVISLGGSSTTSPQNGDWFSPFFVLDSGAIAYEDTTVTYIMKWDIWAEVSGAGGQTIRSNTQSGTNIMIFTDD